MPVVINVNSQEVLSTRKTDFWWLLVVSRRFPEPVGEGLPRTNSKIQKFTAILRFSAWGAGWGGFPAVGMARGFWLQGAAAVGGQELGGLAPDA